MKASLVRMYHSLLASDSTHHQSLAEYTGAPTTIYVFIRNCVMCLHLLLMFHDIFVAQNLGLRSLLSGFGKFDC